MLFLLDIARSISNRDYKDRTRGISPLRVAKGAIVVDTTHMSLSEVAKFILDKVKEWYG